MRHRDQCRWLSAWRRLPRALLLSRDARGLPGYELHALAALGPQAVEPNLWRLSRHRRIVPATGPRAGPREARSPAPSHPATHGRPGDVRADLEHSRADWGRAAGDRSYDQPGPHVDLPLL